MRIYTKYGDNGTTQLRGGQQTRKNDGRVVLCGALDELNAVLGVVASFDLPDQVSSQITRIQSDLFVAGAAVAAIGAEGLKTAELGEEPTTRLENDIDSMETVLAPLRNFLLPGGAPAAATMHLARAVCRRSEISLTDLVDRQDESFRSTGVAAIQKYLNRLSDWCFVAARFLNHHHGVEEPIWTSEK